ncbi:MAG: hypothetical protein GY801_46715 [bacterium]|nr:hypothetical protein [bacterium]
MNQALIAQVTDQLEALPDDLLNPVLEFIQSLKRAKRHGIPGRKLMKFAGSISTEDAEHMLQSIEQDCRKVDINEW